MVSLVKPVVKVTTAKPVAKATIKAAVKPVAKVTTKPTVKATVQPAVKVTTKAAVKPAATKPAVKVTTKASAATKQQATTKGSPAAVTTAKSKTSQNVIHKLVDKLVTALKPISKIVDIKKIIEERSNATTAMGINQYTNQSSSGRRRSRRSGSMKPWSAPKVIAEESQSGNKEFENPGRRGRRRPAEA